MVLCQWGCDWPDGIEDVKGKTPLRAYSYNKNAKTDQSHTWFQGLGDVIGLTVSEDQEGKTPPRAYSYDELLDLQSRLMLVAGQAEKGKENVDRFITVSHCSFSSVLFISFSCSCLVALRESESWV